MRKPFDFQKLADNGLRRGVTTGTCATAAIQASLSTLLGNEPPQTVQVNLPDGVHYVALAIESIASIPPDGVQASVIKDAGDDPDVTHGAVITGQVRKNNLGTLRFLAGPGVGTITLAGFEIPVGEPAINVVPRAMMRHAVNALLQRHGIQEYGYDLMIGCQNGEAIAQKTYNPRLGIIGGISILGTTGIVEPKSLSSWLASIELYIQIALAELPERIVFSPGNLGQSFAMEQLQLPKKSIIQMANFIGFSLDALDHHLEKLSYTLPRLLVAGHPGKLAKVLAGHWETHSSVSPQAIAAICDAAQTFSVSHTLIEQCRKAPTVEAIIRQLAEVPRIATFWHDIETAIAQLIQQQLKHVQEVEVRLFSIDGTPLRPADSV